MKEEIKERWVSALRSGKFTQGKDRLKTDDEDYCCLGVLCELAVEDKVIAPAKDTEDFGWIYEDEQGTLPNKVREWAGLAEDNPYVEFTRDGEARYESLSELNDDLNLSFKEIALIIEEKL